MECLQDNYDELSDDCQEAVEKFTEDEDHYIDLDRILMQACTPMIKDFCGVRLFYYVAAIFGSKGGWGGGYISIHFQFNFNLFQSMANDRIQTMIYIYHSLFCS